jgi:mutator protein MutT
MQNLPPVKKVIASVIKQNGKFLIAQRAKQDSLYGKWEFPGGKMEEGETEKECLHRELFEEFGIKAEIGNYLCSSFFEHKGNLTEMRAYSVLSYSGELQLFDHQQIAWVEAENLLSFDMPEPDRPIIEYICNNNLE